ncbi:Retrovirus-related Pol polyprotein from transposon 17.6 [Dictyocoela muelleri]|nr:Retrovirus-related Pol polyprotein from transposon 17.6 [Dictyocoela muelleri]
MKRCCWFSSIDLKNGFNQILLEEKSREITGFNIINKHYQYKRIPFGIKSGPKIFQKIMNNILENINNIFVYIDDIIIYSKSREEHYEIISKVLDRLREYNVKINFEKSKFFVNELKILGYLVNKDGIKSDKIYLENKIFNKDIKTKKDVQKLLGILNWYRLFIPNMSNRVSKISDLLKIKGLQIKWTDEMKKIILDIKNDIKRESILIFPDYNKKFILQCDASDDGIGAILMQENGIVSHYSRKFKKSEKKIFYSRKRTICNYKIPDKFPRNYSRMLC